LNTIRIIGPGRAGLSLAAALERAGAHVPDVLGRGDDVSKAAYGADAIVIATPDREIESVAESIEPVEGTGVLHLSGSLGLEVLSRHPRRGSLHPLVTLPDPVIGADRLGGGAWFAIAGDTAATELVQLLGGHPFTVPEGARVLYHAAASVAANHLVGLLAEVERIAQAAGLPFEAFIPLAAGALEDVRLLGTAPALTGPVARGDEAVVAAHRAVLDPAELAGYDAGVELTRRIAATRSSRAAAAEAAGTTAWS
jgi:predicted short-subunit dehydrogenase-like oxidoreductase (DUF2520 family)